MKRNIKTLLLSAFVAVTASATAVATVLTVTPATAETQTSRFAMVEGAAIRYSEPLGLRFIAELGTQEYTELTAEDGVKKELGMFIMPFEYIDTDADGAIDVTDYADVDTKLDYTFYSSDGSVNKVYEHTDENGDTYYRANGVISDLKLKNYAREFVGIGYIKETRNGITKYEYTDIVYEDNVRSAAYVAIEAHADDDYDEIDNAKRTFEKYVDGAQLYDAWNVTETETDGVRKYQYNGNTYNSLAEVKAQIANYDYTLSFGSVKYVKEGGTTKLGITDATHSIDFKGAHAKYTSSNESIVKVDKYGTLTWVKNGSAKITAEFMGKTKTCDVISGVVDFEDGEVPSVMKFTGARVASFTTTDMNGGKVMEVKSVSDAYGDVCVIMPRDVYGAFFEDPTVQYLAFDLKLPEGATTTRAQVSYRAGDAQSYPAYELGGYDTAPAGVFKSYYLPRSVYEAWVANNVTDTRLLNLQRGVQDGASMYIDNIRAVTAEEKTQDWYSFEYGGLRTNNGNQPLHYDHIETGTWQLGLSNIDSTTATFTNEIVSDGNRAYKFTKLAGETKFMLNHTADPTRELEMRNAGYISYDLYVPEGSDAAAVVDNKDGVYETLKPGWNTIYAKVHATDNVICAFWDSTASTYVIDNIRLLTEEQYNTEMLSFEGKAGVLRDNTSDAKSTVYIYTPRDALEKRWTMVAQGDGAILSNQHYDTEIVKDGESSFAFHKTNGYMSFSFNTGGEMYALLRNGFTFWMYADLDEQPRINGTGTNNFTSGIANQKFNGGTGIDIEAREWTQVVVRAEDINGSGRWLIISGSTAGTYYFDGFRPLTNHTVTFAAGDGSVASTSQTITYGASYTLETPTPAAGYKFLGWYNGDELVPLSGTWTIEGDVTLTAKYEELPKYLYNATGERSEDGSVVGLTLKGGTHNADDVTSTAMPIASLHETDMAYYRFSGNYGLNDFLVFDVTGGNMPIVSFFNNSVKNSIYNHAQSNEEKAWIFFNGIYNHNGLPDGGYSGNLSNRLNLIGPYKISYKADNSWAEGLAGGEWPEAKSNRINDGSTPSNPNPASLARLSGTTDQYRVILGWVANGSSNMNLRVYVWNLTTGALILDKAFGNAAKADWEGDIVLYGHFGKDTVVDKVYPISEDTTIDNVAAEYKPAMQTYNATWDGNELTLNKSTYVGVVNRPNVGTTDMSYIAFNGDYGVGDYVVFDFTGSNMPIVSFFNNEVTNTVYNNASTTADAAGAADENAHGIVICGGLYQYDNTIYNSGGTNSCRLIIVGNQKVLGWDDNSNNKAGGYRHTVGSTSEINPLSVTALKSVTDTYRVIMGFSAAGTLEVRVINMVKGTSVYTLTKTGVTSKLTTGSIALHGQFGKDTVLDTVFGVEENTTISALLTKYAKDTDYSDEAAVELDRYAYSGPSNGTWWDSNNTYHDSDGSVCAGTGCTSASHVDNRTVANYTTYKDAGFNILLAQDSISVNESTWETDGKLIMDKAHEAGLKVILTDGRIQSLSEPITISGSTVNGTAWEIGSGKRFSNQASLDAYVMSCLSLYKDHPAFYGVMLGDEPSYQNAWCYGQVYQSIKRVMPECYVQYNLNPLSHDSYEMVKYWYDGSTPNSTPTVAQTEAAYKNYVTAFLDAMGTDYIQYDDYPFKSKCNTTLGIHTGDKIHVDPTALRNIQIIAEIAKERNLTVKVVTQSCLSKNSKGGHDRIRQVTENDARWLNNYLMGFGVKQINYFTYWTKADNKTEWFEDGGSFVKRDGTTTELYDFMTTIMADNTAFAPTISHFDYSESQVFGQNNVSSLDNTHSTWSTSLTAKADFKWVTGVTVNYEYALLTELYDAENYNYMYMVMNTSDPHYNHKNVVSQSITVTFDGSFDTIYVYDQTGARTEVQLENNAYTIILAQGQAVYLMPKI